MVQIIETCHFSIYFLQMTNQAALFNIYNNSPIKIYKKKKENINYSHLKNTLSQIRTVRQWKYFYTQFLNILLLQTKETIIQHHNIQCS